MITLQKNREGGFTLIEVIITIVIVAILGTIFVTFMGTGVVGSSTPVININSSLSLRKVMENMTADYRNTVFSKADLITLRTNIGAEGTSPVNNYGSYTVDRNRFILFDGTNTEANDAVNLNLLKVTIKNSLGEMLTVLFSAQ